MRRRDMFYLGAAGAAPAFAAPAPPPVEDTLKITGVRLVRTRPKRPVPRYTPAPGSWSTGGVEVANPVSIYPKYKATRSLFQPDRGGVSSFTVAIDTDYGRGGPGGGPIIEGHLTKLLLGENALDIERLWDILWRSTMSYGRKGVTVNAISGVDLALWDIAGKVYDAPVWRLLGGRIHPRIPCYCTGNDIEQHVEFGYKRLKLALPYGPADGREGIRKNVELVKRTRSAVGPDGDVILGGGGDDTHVGDAVDVHRHQFQRRPDGRTEFLRFLRGKIGIEEAAEYERRRGGRFERQQQADQNGGRLCGTPGAARGTFVRLRCGHCRGR